MIRSASYRWLEQKWQSGETVVLDGGVGSELERLGFPRARNLGHLWGTRALYEAPSLTHKVHRRYVEAGVDIIKTNTWQLGSMPSAEAEGLVDARSGDWRAKARLAISLARDAVTDGERADQCAVAFSLSSRGLGRDFLDALIQSISDDLPDLFLIETLTTPVWTLEFRAFEQLISTGIPLWLAFRRSKAGVCDVHGEIIERDAAEFEEAVQRLERIGVAAILVNCLPIASVSGILPILRDRTALPLGIYPNLGRYINPGWEFTPSVSPEEYAAEAARWRDEEGAQIVGGCCGVTPEHVAAVSDLMSRIAGAEAP